eukprot:1695146-Prorocentrum_lima.AAC.1
MKTAMETAIDEVDQLEQNIIHNVEKDNRNAVVEISASTESERTEPASPEQQVPRQRETTCPSEVRRE